MGFEELRLSLWGFIFIFLFYEWIFHW
jgi:hypothetical protein